MRLNDVVVIVLSALIGYVGQGNGFLPVWFHVLTLLVPVLWVATQNRLSGGLVLFAFHLVATRGLIVGAVNYLSVSLFVGVMLWVAYSFAIFLVGYAVWHHKISRRRFHMILLLILMVIPPFGLLIGGHPLLASGWLFPSFGGWGFLLVICLMMLLTLKNRPFFNSLMAVIPLLLIAGYLYQKPLVMDNWKGHQTQLPIFNFEYQNSFIKDFERHQLMIEEIKQSEHRVHVFPESIAGYWTKTAARHWVKQMKYIGHHKVVVMGALQKAEGNSHYNVLVKVDRHKADVIYQQRYPVPVNMWNPWINDQNKISLNSGTVQIDQQSVGLLICYESILLLPMLENLFHHPDVLLFVSNLWWAPESVMLLMRQSMVSMSLLFTIPLVESSNV